MEEKNALRHKIRKISKGENFRIGSKFNFYNKTTGKAKVCIHYEFYLHFLQGKKQNRRMGIRTDCQIEKVPFSSKCTSVDQIEDEIRSQGISENFYLYTRVEEVLPILEKLISDQSFGCEGFLLTNGEENIFPFEDDTCVGGIILYWYNGRTSGSREWHLDACRIVDHKPFPEGSSIFIIQKT